MLKQIIDRKKLIIVFTVLFIVFSLGIDMVSKYNRQTMILTLSYRGTKKGLNPDGTRFVISEIKSESILNEALKGANLKNYTVSDIKDRIDIYPILSPTSMEIVKLKVANGADYQHIPNEFRISYSQKNKLEKNHTIIILEELAKAYSNNFMYKYVEDDICLLPENYSDSKYEYVEIAELYIDKINSMIAYLQKHNNENGTFRADSTNYTFGDILSSLKNLRDIDVGKYKSFVIASGLAKDKEAYLNKLKYAIDMQSYDYEKSQQSAKFTEEAINKYDPNITGVMFIPSLDSSNRFYMSRTKTGIDYLTSDAFTRGTNAGNIKTGIDYKKYLINSFASTEISFEEKHRLKIIANELLTNIYSKIEEISKLAIDTDEEYMQIKTGNYIKFQIPTNSISKYFNIKRTLFTGIKGMFIAIMYVIIKSLIFNAINLLNKKKPDFPKFEFDMEVDAE